MSATPVIDPQRRPRAAYIGRLAENSAQARARRAAPSPLAIAPIATGNRRALLARRRAALDTFLSPTYLDWLLGERTTRPTAA